MPQRFRIGLIILLLTGASKIAQGAPAGMAELSDSIKPVPVLPAGGVINPHVPVITRTTLAASETAATLPIEIALKIRNFAELQARVGKGEHVSPAEMAAKYEPLPADYENVVDWLKGQGLTITRVDSHHMAVFASGQIGLIQQATHANFARVAFEGKEYTSAISAPSLPTSFSSLVLGINGLQPHSHPHPHILYPNASGGASASYIPSQIAHAYQADTLYTNNITGAGQTIAIVIDTFPSTDDLISFWQTYNVNQSINNIQFIQAVALPPNDSLPLPSGEETLDVEWSSSMAPGAKVRVYAATDLGDADLDTAYQQVYDDVLAHPEYNIHQMSMSFGIAESLTTLSQVDTDDQFFVELTNAGVTCFASAGDNGSTPGESSQTQEEDESGPLGCESPASDPDVTSVGGTTLVLNGSNNVTSETVWNNNGSAGGGGTSIYFSKQSWQTGTGVASGNHRLVPDITAAADPNEGAVTIFAGEVGITGGTSWASPTCAGMCALLNQARADLGQSAIGLLGPSIYPLIGTSSFRDITSGNNATPTSGGLWAATVGYDEASGIGAPLMLPLVKALTGASTLVGVTQQPQTQLLTAGSSATFTVAASGSPTNYRWQRMASGTSTFTNLTDGGAYSGSGTSSLTILNVLPAMNGDRFQCVVNYATTATVTSAPPSVLTVQAPWTVATLAGFVGDTGELNNNGEYARFDYPTGMAVDSLGNIFVADTDNNAIREITPTGSVSTPYGSLSGTSGSTNSTGNSALFNAPRDIAIDSSNNLYVADEGNNLIRKITASTGAVSTFASSFNEPRGVAIDSSGNIYVTDFGNDVIRKITPGGTVSIVAGQVGQAGYVDGAATTQAKFNQPIGIAVDSAQNVYVADYQNYVVRKITPGGTVSTLAGVAGTSGYMDGPGNLALFNQPRGIRADQYGNIYLTDSYAPLTSTPEFSGNNLLRKITPNGVVSTFAGQAGIAGSAVGLGTEASFYSPCGLAFNSASEMYIADAANDTIRTATPPASVVVTAGQPNASVQGNIDGGFTVTRTGSTTAALTVDYSVAGTAVSGTDYTALSGIVTIPAGSSSVTVPVVPLSDSAATTNLTVQLTLTGDSSSVELDTPNSATVTIDETPSSQLVTFSQWETNNSISGQPTDTPFNDGVPNLLKYLFHIDPTVPMTAASRQQMPTVAETTINGVPYITLTFQRYVDVTGVTINVQFSPDLQTWTTVNPPGLYQQIGTSSGDPILKVGMNMTGMTQGFLRLKITQP